MSSSPALSTVNRLRSLYRSEEEPQSQSPLWRREAAVLEALTEWRAGSVSDRRTPVAYAPGSPKRSSLLELPRVRVGRQQFQHLRLAMRPGLLRRLLGMTGTVARLRRRQHRV